MQYPFYFKKLPAILLTIFLMFGLFSLQLESSRIISFLEPIFFIIVSLAILYTSFRKSNRLKHINNFEFAFIFYTCYLIVRTFLVKVPDINTGITTFSVLLLYFAFKLLNANLSNEIFAKTILIIIGIHSVYFLGIFFFGYFSESTAFVYYFPNKSVFGILLAIQIAFMIPFLFREKSLIGVCLNRFYWFVPISLTIEIILLIYSESRSGWLGLLVACFILMLFQFKSKKLKYTFLISAIIFLSVSFSFLFIYKQNSSEGRLLIYRISSEIVKDNVLTGIGPGQFKTSYNIYQSEYFRNHNINGKDAYLADDTNFAFNDFLQIFAEQGIIGVILFFVLVFFTIKNIKKEVLSKKNNPIFFASVASLTVIVVAALFSYPFEVIPILIYVPLWLAIIQESGRCKLIFKLPILLFKLTGVLIAIVLQIHSFFLMKYRLKSRDAFNLSRSGFIQAALVKYAQLENSYIKEGITLYLHAELLKNTNQPDNAWKEIEKAKDYISSPKVYLLAASIAEEMGNLHEAEKNYLTAVTIIPNRIVPRYELLKFYLKNRQLEKARYWAFSIKNMSAKVPSQTVSTIKRDVSHIIDTLGFDP